MSFNPSGMVNPMQFSDLGAITGLDPSLAQPVPPPVIFDPMERAQQAIAPTQAKYQVAKQTVAQAQNYFNPQPATTSTSAMSGSYDFGSSPHR